MAKQESLFNKFDPICLGIYLFLVILGCLNIYAAEFDPEHPGIFDFTANYGKQILWMLISFVLVFIIYLFDAKFFSTFSYHLYILGLISLVLVLFIGTKVAGSTSWFQIGGVKIQPAEFAKVTTALALSKFISSGAKQLSSFKNLFLAFVIISIPIALILLQGDVGSAIVFTTLTLVLYREGLSGTFLFVGFALVVICLLSLVLDQVVLMISFAILCTLFWLVFRKKFKRQWLLIPIFIIASAVSYGVDYGFNTFLKPHHQDRINIILGLEHDLQGIGYNLNQSMIAIGSGGAFGKGYLKGTQTKFDFVPEQSTDFIFCTVGEEWGFLGSLLVVGAFTVLLLRIITMAERQRSYFSRVYGYCLVSILFFHFLVNVGMTIGLVPVIGIPLPFVSYGGSSLMSFTVLLFIFLKLDSERRRIIT